MVTIILYPRLNIHLGCGLPHLGLMHLLATNLIVWMRTVIKESVHEYHQAEERWEDQVHHIVQHVNTSDILAHVVDDQHGNEHKINARLEEGVEAHDIPAEKCRDMFHDDDFVSSILQATSPFLRSIVCLSTTASNAPRIGLSAL